MPRSYEDQVSNFEKNYGFEKGRLEKFFSSQKAPNSTSKEPSQLYNEGLHTLLSEYAENQIKPTSIGSDFSLNFKIIHGIIKDYENLMQARHEKLNVGQPREAFEGTPQQVVDNVRGLLNTWDTPLVTSWTNRIKDGTYNISDLRKITNEAYKKGSCYFKEIDDTEPRFIDDENYDAIAAGETVYMMREAMEKLIQSRSVRWYFNPLNWGTAIREALYMRELNKQVKGPKENLIPINDEAAVRGAQGAICRDDRKELYDFLKNTEKEIKQQAERLEHRRLKALEEAKNKEQQKVNEENLENKKSNEVQLNEQIRKNGEKVEFNGEFKENDNLKSPVIKNEDKTEKTIVRE